MPTPSSWQANSVGLKRASDVMARGRVAGLDLLAAAPAGAWPSLLLRGGARAHGNGPYLAPNMANDDLAMIAATAIGALSVPGQSVPAITETAGWEHVSLSYAGQFDLTLSRLTLAALLETSATSLRLCAGNVQKYTTDGTVVANGGTGLSTPKYVAYHTSGGYQVSLLSTTTTDLSGMDQPWLLVYWGGNSHWLDCTIPLSASQDVQPANMYGRLAQRYAVQADAPLLLTFGVNPSSIVQTADQGGFDLVFPSAAAALSLMPLFGRLRQPATATNSWNTAANLPTATRNQIQAWYPRCQQFPRTVAETYAYNAGTDTATTTTTITWTQVRAGGQKFAPLPPLVGVARDTGLAGLSFSGGTIVDGNLPSEYGPTLGIVGVDSYSRSLSGLAAAVAPRAAPGAGPIPTAVQARIDAEVDALVGQSHWAPWYHMDRWAHPNSSGHVYWSDPAEMFQLATEAVPLVGGVRQTALKDWLRAEQTAYPAQTVYSLGGSGTSRGPNGIPGVAGDTYMRNRAGFYPGSRWFETRRWLYAAWGLARYYQTLGDAVSAPLVTALVDLLDLDLPERDWATSCRFAGQQDRATTIEDADRHWAGLCGLAWLCANKSGGADSNEDLVRALLAEATLVRVGLGHLPRWQANAGLVTLPTDLGSPVLNQGWLPKVAVDWAGPLPFYTWASGADDPRLPMTLTQYDVFLDDSDIRAPDAGFIATMAHASSPVYRWLIRPLAMILAQALGAEAAVHFAKYRELQPHWWLPDADPVMGQERNLQAPHEPYGFFKAHAWLASGDLATLERESGYPQLAAGGDLFSLAKAVEVAYVAAATSLSGPYASAITAPSTVARRSKFEVRFQVVNSVATNPFLFYDPSPPPGQNGAAGVTVDVEFSDDNFASQIVCPGFVCQRFDEQVKLVPGLARNGDWLYPLDDLDHEKVSPDSLPWAARFSPPRAGSWVFRIRTTDAGGTNLSAVVPFIVTASAARGRVRRASADSRYFEYEDGSVAPRIGFNLKQNSMGLTEADDATQIVGPVFAQLAAAGVNYVRLWATNWGTWGAESRLLETTQPSNPYPFLAPALAGAPAPTPEVGSELVAYVSSSNFSIFIGHNHRTPACKRSTTYRLRIRYQITGVAGTDDLPGPLVGGHPYGFCGKTSQSWIFNYPTEPEEWDKGTVVTNQVHVATGSTWGEVSGTFTTRSNQDFFDYLIFTNSNCGPAGTMIGHIFLEEDLGGGNYGPNLIPQPWPDLFQTTDQRGSRQFDLLVEAAEANGISLQTVMLGAKQDFGLVFMSPTNGTISASPPGQDHFFGPAGSRARWLHKAVARYYQGRWGYSSAIFGWEFVNEGDPGTGNNHFAAAQEWATDLQGLGDAPLVGTSTSGDFPASSWATFPAADWVDFHFYPFKGATTSMGDPAFSTLASDWYDTASLVSKISLALGAHQPNGLNRPTIHGETGLVETTTDDFTHDLDADTAGIWWHKFLWAQVNVGGVLSSYWYVPEHLFDPTGIGPNHLAQTRYFADWIAAHPLNNGQYVDLAGSLSDSTNLRVFGQKDPINNDLLAWIDCRSHTWKTVVDGTPVTAGSGTLTIPVSTNGNYQVAWTNPYTGGLVLSETVPSLGNMLTLTLPGPISTDLAVSASLPTVIIPNTVPEYLPSFGYGAQAGGVASWGYGGMAQITVPAVVASFGYGSVDGMLPSFGYGGSLVVPAVQLAPPTSDSLDEGWTDQLGGSLNLWTTLDEPSPNDADYVQSPGSPSGQRFRVSLAPLDNPGVSSGHIVRYRIGKDTANQTVNVTVRLLQGSTIIASWVESDVPLTLTTVQRTLSGAQAASITDYSLLALEFEASAS